MNQVVPWVESVARIDRRHPKANSVGGRPAASQERMLRILCLPPWSDRKAHDGVDRNSRMIHSLVATPASTADSKVVDRLLHGRKTRVDRDQDHIGRGERIRGKAPKAKDFNNRHGKWKGIVDEQLAARNSGQERQPALRHRGAGQPFHGAISNDGSSPPVAPYMGEIPHDKRLITASRRRGLWLKSIFRGRPGQNSSGSADVPYVKLVCAARDSASPAVAYRRAALRLRPVAWHPRCATRSFKKE